MDMTCIINASFRKYSLGPKGSSLTNSTSSLSIHTKTHKKLLIITENESNNINPHKSPLRKSSSNMALQNLHEMIRNLSSYIKSLEVLCESGLRLAKNFERLLSPGPILSSTGTGVASSSQTQQSQHLDGDVLSQSVATWELAHKVATADSNALISELLPLLQETVQNVMKDPSQFHSNCTYEVFRSCFSAFFQIQWRFCSLYLQCSSSSSSGYGIPGYFSRTPPDFLARSPTTGSFSFSSGDRRESTESCMSSYSFSLPRSSISGMSSISSRSTSPSFQLHHPPHLYGSSRSRNSSPSVKFTPSQPPSPLLPYGEGGYPSLFRRWSAATQALSGSIVGGSGGGGGGASSSSSSGPHPISSTNISSFSSSYASSTTSNPGFRTLGFSRRWSVPAATHHQVSASVTESSRINEDELDYGLLDAINLLSVKPPSPSTLKITSDEMGTDFTLEQSTSLWPPSDSMPGVVLTTCTTGEDTLLSLESLQRQTAHPSSLRVPFVAPEGSLIPQGLQTLGIPPGQCGEYSLFGGVSSTTSSNLSQTPSSSQSH